MLSDHLPDSPEVARAVCPECEPLADFTREVLETRWCHRHAPTQEGVMDGRVDPGDAPLSGSAEAGGEENRRFCNWLRQQRKKTWRPP